MINTNSATKSLATQAALLAADASFLPSAVYTAGRDMSPSGLIAELTGQLICPFDNGAAIMHNWSGNTTQLGTSQCTCVLEMV